MAKKIVSAAVEEVRKLVDKDIIIGLDRTVKALREGKLAKVFLASNCDELAREDIMHYCSLNDIECVSLTQTSEELGTLCRKPFFVSVIGVPKEVSE